MFQRRSGKAVATFSLLSWSRYFFSSLFSSGFASVDSSSSFFGGSLDLGAESDFLLSSGVISLVDSFDFESSSFTFSPFSCDAPVDKPSPDSSFESSNLVEPPPLSVGELVTSGAVASFLNFSVRARST